VVQVRDAAGTRLGTGDWDPDAQIRVRVFAFGKDEVDEGPGPSALDTRCLAARAPAAGTDALRLVHSGSGRPAGLTVDRYADWSPCVRARRRCCAARRASPSPDR
jgi:23S rRNA G2069 N7-methylase RlmK/C1962 C5-methylase RlmI